MSNTSPNCLLPVSKSNNYNVRGYRFYSHLPHGSAINPLLAPVLLGRTNYVNPIT